jgi:stage II sporulation protein M
MLHKITSENVKRNYTEAFGYLREAMNSLLIAIFIFLIGISIGLLYPLRGEGLLSAMKTMARHLSGRSALSIAGAIFLKNSLSAAISVMFGPLLGIVPILGAVGNGLLIGTVLSHVNEANRTNTILQLIPHGLFELPAIFMAWGIGIWQGTWVFHKKLNYTFQERRRKAFRILFMIIIPLLLIAAVVEGIGIVAKR